MSKIHIADSMPMLPKHCACWIIEFDGGNRKLLITSPEVTLQEAIVIIKNYHPAGASFMLHTIDAGYLTLPDKMQSDDNTYSGDGRRVDHNGFVYLGEDPQSEVELSVTFVPPEFKPEPKE